MFFFLSFPSFPSLGAGWFLSFGLWFRYSINKSLSGSWGLGPVRFRQHASRPASLRGQVQCTELEPRKRLLHYLIVLALTIYCCGLIYYFEIIVVMARIKNIYSLNFYFLLILLYNLQKRISAGAKFSPSPHLKLSRREGCGELAQDSRMQTAEWKRLVLKWLLKEPLVFNEGEYSREVGVGKSDVVGNDKLLDKAENNMVINTQL